MECHVLMPRELELVVRRPSGGFHEVGRLLEPSVGVAARVGVSKGDRFTPVGGTGVQSTCSVRCARVEIYSQLGSEDVSELIVFVIATM
jgi:hypothetical protein